MKSKDRALGLRCLRRHKLWERAGFQCHEYAAKIEELLLQMDQAQLTQQVGFPPGLLRSSPLCLKVRLDFAKTGAPLSSVPFSLFLLDFRCSCLAPECLDWTSPLGGVSGLCRTNFDSATASDTRLFPLPLPVFCSPLA